MHDELPRDRHLFGPGPKRILTIDGGGVRGSMAIAFLERLEALIAQREGRTVRLCDWFDLIGGTSTGAIIATTLAMGFSAGEIKDFYNRLAPRVFRRMFWRLPGWTAKFEAAYLQAELDAVLADRRLGTVDLQTGLGLVLKRIDTGGSWLLLNNRRSAYWATPDDRSFIGNADLPLATLVRASTAAPHYFDPQIITITEGKPPGLFLDGGMTPHNNPSLAFFLAAALPPFGLNWPCGPANLKIMSVGTGTYRPTVGIAEAKRSHPIGLAVKALAAQIADAQHLTLLLMSWFGETSSVWPIAGQIGVAPPQRSTNLRRCSFRVREIAGRG